MIPLRLLQVEDAEVDALIVRHELSCAGFDVFAVRVDNAEALRRELTDAQWNLVISDYTMPGFTGAEALAIVRQCDAHVPFIFVSGTIGEEAAVAAMRNGAQDYIIKANLARLVPVVERELADAAVRHERHLANQHLTHLAYHDRLTELPNRALLHVRLREAILRSQRDGQSVALLAIDLDGFRDINDAFGHEVGDRVLKEVAERLNASLRPSDTVARWEGDEFAVLLPATDAREAEVVARQVLRDFERPFNADDRAVMVAASIGIAGYPHDAASGEELLQKADAAMSVAKNDKASFSRYIPGRDRRDYQPPAFATALRQAVDSRQFILEYQPIVSLLAGTTVAVEALVRWAHPERGLLAPAHFIRAAEHTGLMNPLTSFVVGRALSEWSSPGPDACAIAVNVSAKSLRHTAFAGQIREMLARYGVAPSRLSLEITERLIMSDPDGSARRLNELHDTGVRIVIDDFGTGYTSLSDLHKLPVDALKIDRSFVLGLSEGQDDTMVRCMIDLAHNLGLEVVAEGVETAEVLQQLTALGCDSAQGFYFRRPGTAEDTARWMTRPFAFD